MAEGYNKDEAALAPSKDDKAEESEEESDDDDVVDDEEFERQMAAIQKKGPRTSVAAEKTTVAADWKPPVHKKTEEQADVLKKAVGKSFMFSSITDPRMFNQIIDAFDGPHTYKAGDEVIGQGHVVDSGEPGLFVIESGTLDVYKKSDANPAPGAKVFTYDTMGQSFGELALMYNAPRAATVVASSDCVVWSIDRDTFNNCVIGGYQAQREKNAEFLKSVEILSFLTLDALERLVDVIKTKAFDKGASIIKKDEIGDEFFLLHEGTAVASVDGATVKEYTPGSYFGELALLEKCKRKADVVATSTPTVVAVIDSESFTNLLGNVHDLMKDKAKDYEPLPETQAEWEPETQITPPAVETPIPNPK